MDSKCVRCEEKSFEIVPAKIAGANVKFSFVRCSKCGTVISAIENVTPEELAKRIVTLLQGR